MLAGVTQEAQMQQVIVVLPGNASRAGKFKDRTPDFMRGGTRRHRRPKRHMDGIRNLLRHLPEKPTPLEAEDAAPNTVEMNRDHRHVQSVEYSFQAPLERQHVASTGDGTLGEDADHMPGFQFVPRAADRIGPILRAAAHGYRMRQAHEPVKDLHFVNRTPNHEADETLNA